MAEDANKVLAGPASGSPATPAYRYLVDADLTANTTAVLSGDITSPLLYTEVHEHSAGVQTTTWDLPAGTLSNGGTGIDIEVAGKVKGGGTDSISVTFGGGSNLVKDGGGNTITYPANANVVIRIKLRQPSGSPGSAIAYMDVSGSDGSTPDQNARVEGTYISFDHTAAQTISVAWASAGSVVQVFNVTLIGDLNAGGTTGTGDTAGTPTAVAAGAPNVMIVQQRSGTAPGLYRMSSLATVGGLVGTNTFGSNETGTQTSFWYARFNDWVEFKGKEYVVSTTGTSAHKIYERPIGGTLNATAVDTETFTVSSLNRSGLHVCANGSQELMVLVFSTSTYLKITTYDGTTWTTYSISGFFATAPTVFTPFGVAYCRGILYVPFGGGAGSPFEGVIAVNPFAGTATKVTGIQTGQGGCCATLAGRVFYMTSASGAASQRTLYEISAGAMVSRLVLTSGGTDTVTAQAVAGCLFQIGDLELVACYPTNTGATAANAFWAASKITFASTTDTAPTETVASFLDTTLTTAGSINGVTTSKNLYAFVDNETNPGVPAIWLFKGATTAGGAYAVAQYLGLTTALSWTNTGANQRDHSIPAGDFGGGQRIAPDDTANAITDVTTSFAIDTANAGQETLTFKLQIQGSDTWTMKLWISSYEGTVMFQATLAGTATGGSAVRTGNSVTGCAGNTSHTVNVDWDAMGIANRANVKFMLKFYRE